MSFGEEGVEQGFDDVLVFVGQALDLLELAEQLAIGGQHRVVDSPEIFV